VFLLFKFARFPAVLRPGSFRSAPSPPRSWRKPHRQAASSRVGKISPRHTNRLFGAAKGAQAIKLWLEIAGRFRSHPVFATTGADIPRPPSVRIAASFSGTVRQR